MRIKNQPTCTLYQDDFTYTVSSCPYGKDFITHFTCHIEGNAGDRWMESVTLTEDWRTGNLGVTGNKLSVQKCLICNKKTFQNIISGNISQLDSMSWS